METWGTSEELNYLSNVGNNFSERHVCHIRKLNRYARDAEQDEHTVALLTQKVRILKKYIEAAPQRVNWGKIDRDTVMGFATKELVRLERNLAL